MIAVILFFVVNAANVIVIVVIVVMIADVIVNAVWMGHIIVLFVELS